MISGPYSRSVEVREIDVERYLCKRAEECGIVAEKFTSPNRRHVPDRIVWVGKGKAFFVECKAPGKTATKGQQRDHDRRRAAGYKVYVADSYDSVNYILMMEDFFQ